MELPPTGGNVSVLGPRIQHENPSASGGQSPGGRPRGGLHPPPRPPSSGPRNPRLWCYLEIAPVPVGARWEPGGSAVSFEMRSPGLRWALVQQLAFFKEGNLDTDPQGEAT